MHVSLASSGNSQGALRHPEWPGIRATLRAAGDTVERWKPKVSAALPCALALAAVAICTWVSFKLGQSSAFPGFLYLVFVVLAALYGGFWQATVVSIGAAACLNYYFVPPIFSFANSPANWAALGAFEFTALVISRLSQRARLQALDAQDGRLEMERLYETSRRILLLDTNGEPGKLITSLIREIFHLEAVQLFDPQSGNTYKSGGDRPDAEPQTRDAYFIAADRFDAPTRSWFCVLRLGTRPVGSLALIGTEMSKLAATALASLTAIALERARALKREARAQAARQTERLRTAVLDALAHEFKTPLTVARTASSGLLAVGGLSELQAELIGMIDGQVSKLDRLASRLLTSARLDTAEFRPQPEVLFFSQVVDAAIEGVEQNADRARFRVSVPAGEVPILADRELILNSVMQLLDNALKYSDPGSPIDIGFAVEHATVVVRVRSKGLEIGPADCERVFERFYRAPETHHLPSGTGLGLSIVKKIVEAHRGHVWAEGEKNYGTSFSIALPAAAGR
jgi:two-component system, OmpR family, sensor histidine kinase KdpD